MNNIKLVIAYDGSDYLGWQKTLMGPSVEETLQQVIQLILQEEIDLQAASRTDAGVHARGQVVNFILKKAVPSLEKFLVSLNQLLPKSIVALSAEEMPVDFHPTLNCLGKVYHYALCLGHAQLPQFRFYSWHCPQKMDISAMQQAASCLVGEHDFSAFCNVKKNSRYQDYIRELYRLDLKQLPENRLLFEFEGNHFLYKMVRNLVGTLVDVGKGKFKADDISSLLLLRDRKRMGMTAPAHGLTLHSVLY